MKAKTKFLKMFYKLPTIARKELCFDAYSANPMTLNVIAIEVRADTNLSKILLKRLGFTDDKPSKKKKLEFGGGY